eukprot:c30179_g1_i1 orf=326-1063(-)
MSSVPVSREKGPPAVASPASPETGLPKLASSLQLLLHHCLLDPALLLPSPLRAALLAPFHLEALEPNELLYKHLANALLACTETSAPSRRVFQLLTTFKELMQGVKFRLHVQEPFFSQLKDGSKTVEGRCAVGAYNSILPGDLLLFNDVLTQVVKMVNHYDSFKEMLNAEGLDQVLPGVTSTIEGVAIYRQFYSEEKELSGGVLAIHVKNACEDSQPLTIVRLMLEELAINGVGALQSFIASVMA